MSGTTNPSGEAARPSDEQREPALRASDASAVLRASVARAADRAPEGRESSS
jgi:hypothetical protein